MKFKICSYNMGSNIQDYMLLDKFARQDLYQDPDFAPSEEAFNAARETAVNNILQENISVYCLQECLPGNGHPLIQRIKDAGFILHYNKVEQTAVAIDPRRFEILPETKYNLAYTVITVVDNITHERIALASAWFSGFDLTQSIEENELDYYADGGPYPGDDEANNLQKLLAGKENEVDYQVIGADMNASIEKWYNRFDPFVSHGFTVHGTHQATAINTNDREYQEREIDYFLVKEVGSGILKWIGNVFANKPVSHTVTTRIAQYFKGWDSKANGSDHKPIIMEIKPEFSYINSIFNSVRSLLLQKCKTALTFWQKRTALADLTKLFWTTLNL